MCLLQLSSIIVFLRLDCSSARCVRWLPHIQFSLIFRPSIILWRIVVIVSWFLWLLRATTFVTRFHFICLILMADPSVSQPIRWNSIPIHSRPFIPFALCCVADRIPSSSSCNSCLLLFVWRLIVLCRLLIADLDVNADWALFGVLLNLIKRRKLNYDTKVMTALIA